MKHEEAILPDMKSLILYIYTKHLNYHRLIPNKTNRCMMLYYIASLDWRDPSTRQLATIYDFIDDR